MFPVALGAIFGAACAFVQAPAAPSDQGMTPASWNLVLHVSGGFVGLDRELRVASTGTLIATDRRRKTTATSRASAPRLAELNSLISKLSDRPEGRSNGPTECRDCVHYRVELRTDSRTLIADLDDVSVAGTELESLIKALNVLLNEALAG
jgi:hypothetical protein